MKKAFTITELLVAVGLLAMVLTVCGIIFNYSIDSQRTAGATAEIMRNLRVITDQLNADFAGLRKDGEIFVVWVADPIRADRIMFFATGDFQSYGTPGTPVIRGDLARISYMLAKRGNERAHLQAPEKRILARTQHIFAADGNNFDPAAAHTDKEWSNWHNVFESDRMTMEQWKNILLSDGKKDMLSVITDIRFDDSVPDELLIGADVNSSDPNLIHLLLCQGVGEFKVQGWYAAEKRWVPEVNEGDFSELGAGRVPGLLYPKEPQGVVSLGGDLKGDYTDLLNEEKFDSIPGLGSALKFTFTLYDSKGILKTGRRFEHIVYIGK